MKNMKDFFEKLLCEQFMDELAERVAKKLAQRNGPKNTLFKNESKVPKKSCTRDIYYDSCGPSYNIYDSCGRSSC